VGLTARVALKRVPPFLRFAAGTLGKDGMSGEELFHLSVVELAKRIESKNLSPVELTQVYLNRSEKFGPHLNAYARLTPEIATAQAKTAEKEIQRGHYRGPLHGIPYAAKDLLSVKGVPTAWGAKPYANQVFDYDATVVEHLNRAGAVLLGKASMVELAGGMNYRFASASLQGAAKNPWDTSCWTCGSSSGSGAIVAGGLAAFAIGTETWGSIICPSAFCGVSGLRPTYGRVSRFGAMALAPSMDKIGPMARSAEDCARIFAVLAGHDPKDHGTLPVDKAAFTYSPSMELRTRSLQVGWLTNAWKTLDPSVAKISDATEKALRKYFPAVHHVALPQGPWDDAGNVTMGIESAASFRSLIRSGQVGELADPLGRINGYVNEQFSGADYLQAQRVRELLQKKMADLFDSFDVLAAFSQPVPATPLGANLETDLSFPDPLGAIGNLCGLPALSVPCGFTEKHLPVGLQFVARAGDDFAVIQAARTFQARTDWHRRHPKMA
jgi:aspartyl-tRNA(Asn)/glutamyl-tRNA(Gln) amidotransferase subunit A